MASIWIEKFNQNKEQTVRRNVLKKTVWNENTYKNYQNKLHKLLNDAERSFYNEQILTNKNNIRKTRSIIKTIINKNKSGQNKQTKFMLSDRSVTNGQQMVAEKFNDFLLM